jgi:hypothetical protein
VTLNPTDFDDFDKVIDISLFVYLYGFIFQDHIRTSPQDVRNFHSLLFILWNIISTCQFLFHGVALCSCKVGPLVKL